MELKKIVTLVVLIVFCFSNIPAYADGKNVNATPEPYGIDEFNNWQKDLRRFEIISFGALPFVSLLSFWSYDIIRFIKHKGDSAYMPWPLKNQETAVPLTESEQKKVFFAALGISIGVALIDFTYRIIKHNIKKANEKKLKLNELPPIQLIPIDLENSELSENLINTEPKL